MGSSTSATCSRTTTWKCSLNNNIVREIFTAKLMGQDLKSILDFTEVKDFERTDVDDDTFKNEVCSLTEKTTDDALTAVCAVFDFSSDSSNITEDMSDSAALVVPSLALLVVSAAHLFSKHF